MAPTMGIMAKPITMATLPRRSPPSRSNCRTSAAEQILNTLTAFDMAGCARRGSSVIGRRKGGAAGGEGLRQLRADGRDRADDDDRDERRDEPIFDSRSTGFVLKKRGKDMGDFRGSRFHEHGCAVTVPQTDCGPVN